MPMCPNCKSEFREGFTKCSDCNTNLVEELEPEESNSKINEEQVLLKNVENDFESDIVQSLLKANGIESVRIHKEAGDFLKVYMGGSNFGIDIYVLESDYEEAKKVLDSETTIGDENLNDVQDNDEEAQSFEEDFENEVIEDRNRAFIRRFTAAALVLPTIIALGFSVLAMVVYVITHF